MIWVLLVEFFQLRTEFGLRRTSGGWIGTCQSRKEPMVTRADHCYGAVRLSLRHVKTVLPQCKIGKRSHIE